MKKYINKRIIKLHATHFKDGFKFICNHNEMTTASLGSSRIIQGAAQTLTALCGGSSVSAGPL